MKRELIFAIALLLFLRISEIPEILLSSPTLTSASNIIVFSADALIPAATQSATATSFESISALEPEATPFAADLDGGADVAAIQRVLVISFDGMRADAIAAAGMTHLLQLMETSAYSLSARTISYPTTLPSHTSMLSGMCMEKHGLSFNSRNLYRGYARGSDIFDLVDEDGGKSVMIVAKDKLEQIPAPDTVDVFETYSYEAPIADAAIRIMPSGFDMMFLHFPSADVVGHKRGWMSNFQFSVLREADQSLGDILAALDENGLRDTTLVIVTADHGGHDSTHDGSRTEDYIIPWIISGPGVVPGELQSSIKIMDTAATAAYALGLPLPPDWDGLPVYESFGIPPQDIHYRSGPCE